MKKINISLKELNSTDRENIHLDKNPNEYNTSMHLNENTNKNDNGIAYKNEYTSTIEILNSKTNNTDFFKSRIHELIFYFQTNTAEFDKFIGLKKIHYYKKSRADNLEKLYLSIFHPDKKPYLIKEIKQMDEKIAIDLNNIDFNIVCSQIKLLFKRVTGGLNV